MDPRIKSHIVPILASHIMVRNGEFPTRIVLYNKGTEYVTHKELLKSVTPADGSSCAFEHYAMYDGGYFPYKCADRPTSMVSEDEARHHAEADYRERVRKLAENFR